MDQPFHAGELAVQARAGVGQLAERLAGAIRADIPGPAAEFLQQRSFVVLATIATDGLPRAWVVPGEPGFARALDTARVRLAASSAVELAAATAAAPFVGLLAIDLHAQRRMRVNGRMEREPGGSLLIRVDQVYANCQKYIQRRQAGAGGAAASCRVVRRAGSLSPTQQEWIRQADTFFIASANPGEGADASHRGGLPGFVEVTGDRLRWPDYSGNAMFNTLGNIERHPYASLAFPDFSTGSVLQVTGTACIDWDPHRAGAMAGAERSAELSVTEVVELADVLPHRWSPPEYSRFNPKLVG